MISVNASLNCSLVVLNLYGKNEINHFMCFPRSQIATQERYKTIRYRLNIQSCEFTKLQLVTLDYGYDTTIPVKGETLQDGYFIRRYTSLLTVLCSRVS